ncbi:MAG TPA: TetR/AcrR family transcriptional regulator [Actinomycetes bacterium]|nr:TetR/AcrR family transcriptional regulator [Actinomycetes bacterium]
MTGAPTTAVPGSRRRAGNAMGRARAAILLGARQALAESGPRGLTMSRVADRGGVAKATVYNHFRDRRELIDGVALDLVERVLAAGEDAEDLASALAVIAGVAAGLPEIRGAVEHDPSVVALAIVPVDSPAWNAARVQVTGLLARHGAPEPDVAAGWVMRWLVAVAAAAPDATTVSAEADLTAAGVLAGAPVAGR